MGIHTGYDNKTYWAPDCGDWVVIWQGGGCIVGKVAYGPSWFFAGYSLEANSMVIATSDLPRSRGIALLDKFLNDGVVHAGAVHTTEVSIPTYRIDSISRWPHERLPLIQER